MANRVLSIIAKVRDAASQPLNQIQNSLKKTGAAAKQTSVNFTEFNRVMFTTGAFVGFFTKSFSKFGDALLQGAQLDRLQTQFERIMGPKGDLFKSIAGFTDNSIDKVEALRSAIAMKTLGIASSTAQTAELIARAGTAAKLAGIDSGEGIKKFTQFLKDGSIANLEFLNLIKSNDPALKLQMSMIGKYGGVLGGALTAQMKYNMGLRLLRAATQNALKGQRDLYDVVYDVKQSFSLLKSEVGIFIGTAISSLLDKITKAVDRFSAWLETVRHTKKEILFLAKSFILATSALAGFMATVGTLRLLAIGLKAVGISTMPIIFGFTTLVGLFTSLTAKVKQGATPIERFTEKLRVFAAVLKGVFQLVSSYLTEQDNFAKGIGKMDRELFELLNNNGLFKFVHKVAQVTAVISKFVIETFKQLRDWAIALDEQLGALGNKFLGFFGANQKIDVDLDATGNVIDEPKIKRISDIWVNSNQKVYKLLVKGAAGLAVAFAGFKLLGIGKGILSKIPIIGKFFAPKTGKPTGSKNDPLYVKNADRLQGALNIVDSINALEMMFKKPMQTGKTLIKNIVKLPIIRTLVKPFIKVASVFKPIIKNFVKSPIVRAMLKPFIKVGNVFKPVIRNIIKAPIVRMLIKPFVKVANVFKPIFRPLFRPFFKIASLLGMDKMKGIAGFADKIGKVRFIPSMFMNFLRAPAASIGKLFTMILKPLQGVASRIMTAFSGLSKFGAVLKLFRVLFLVEAAVGFLHGIIKGLIENFSSFTGLFGAAYDYLKSVDYAQLFQDLYNSVSSTFQGIIGFVGEVAGQIYDAVSASVMDAVAVFKDIGGFIFTKLEEGFGIIAPYLKIVLDPIGEAFATLKTWIMDIVSALSEWYGKLKSIPILGDIVQAAEDVAIRPVQTFSKIGEMVPGVAGTAADMLSNKIKDKTALNFLEQGRAGKEAPFIPVTQEDRYDYAMRAIEQAQGGEQQRMASALRNAQAGTSAGGQEITREEWAGIFGFAINNSTVAKNTKETSSELKKGNQNTSLTSRRGGC